MGLLGITKDITIIMNGSNYGNYDNEKVKMEYPFYEPSYLSGMRAIFQQAIAKQEWDDKKKNRFFDIEKRNILSFIGKRGVGKTTAMNEFCEILSRMHDQKERDWWLTHVLDREEQEKLRGQEFRFHVLKPIDASLLEDKEDLFELIVASIYRKFEKQLNSNMACDFEGNPQVRRIMEMFSEIFKMYRNVVGRNIGDGYGSSMVSKMHFMVGSQEIKEKVAWLIDALLQNGEGTRKESDYSENDRYQYLCQERDVCGKRHHYNNEYIVITIDDLDLNLKHGYEMLEQVQKYFSYHKILVLLALDYEQMRLVCEEHFYREMPQTAKAYKNEGYSEHNRELANDYMIKLFHLSQRMYMPDMKKIASKIEIAVDKTIRKDERILLKEFIMVKTAESMHIFYDGCGLKSHFCEPDTVRALVSYNEFLESLNVIPYSKLVSSEKTLTCDRDTYKKIRAENLEILAKYDQNHERVNRDMNTRMVQNLLTISQERAFMILNDRDIERRARYFVNTYRQGDIIKVGNMEEESYSYGMLLEKIYGWGRIRDNTRDYFEDKPFICCILMLFTSEMVREYINYRYNLTIEQHKNKNRNKYKKRLLAFLGKSFGSSWTGKAFPSIYYREVGNVTTNGNVKPDENVKTICDGYMESVQSKDFRMWVRLDKLQEKTRGGDNWKKSLRTWLDDWEIVPMLECIDMFFVKQKGYGYSGMKYNFTLEVPTQKDKNLKKDVSLNEDAGKRAQKYAIDNRQLLISGEGETMVFDVMAFVVKSLDYDAQKERIQNNIVQGLKKVVGEYRNWTTDTSRMSQLETELVEDVKARSMFKKIEDPSFEHEAAFPFYNLDMSYNICKRLYKERSGKMILYTDLLSGIHEFYDQIKQHLEEEQKFYHDLIDFPYTKIFCECPYIQLIKQICEKKRSRIPKQLSETIKEMGLANVDSVDQIKE